jgi:hypothetical protein
MGSISGRKGGLCCAIWILMQYTKNLNLMRYIKLYRGDRNEKDHHRIVDCAILGRLFKPANAAVSIREQSKA